MVLLQKACSSLRLIQVLLCDKVWVVCTDCSASVCGVSINPSARFVPCGGLMNCVLRSHRELTEAAMHLQW